MVAPDYLFFDSVCPHSRHQGNVWCHCHNLNIPLLLWFCASQGMSWSQWQVFYTEDYVSQLHIEHRKLSLKISTVTFFCLFPLLNLISKLQILKHFLGHKSEDRSKMEKKKVRTKYCTEITSNESFIPKDYLYLIFLKQDSDTYFLSVSRTLVFKSIYFQSGYS
jgi:hypothetical protein